MLTPRKGDYSSVPLSAEGKRVADTWDPSRLATDGCKPYGAAAIMRVPGRLKIAWDNDTTLRIEADAGQQTRLLQFDKTQRPPVARTWQGYSAAEWERIVQPGGLGVSLQQAPPRIGSLKVVTTNLRAGYLRKNGVPYSEDTTGRERVAHGLDDCRRPDVPRPAVPHEHTLQAGTRRVQVDADAVRGSRARRALAATEPPV